MPRAARVAKQRMEFNQEAELVVGLLVALAALAMLARRAHLPYPVVFVLGGLLLALVPGLPALQLAPDLVFLLFLPPLIYSAAVFIPLRDVRVYLRPIILLALGLVVAMTLALAVVAHHLLPGMDWPTALLLGALLSPTDAVAVFAIGEHVQLPDSAAIILEAESLFDDASGLVLYRLALGAVVIGRVSVGQVAGQLLAMVVGGVAIGLVVGALGAWVRRRAADARVETLASLIIPFAAWIPAEQLGLSGAVAVVTAGVFVGRRVLPYLTPIARLQTSAFWEVLTFLLEGLLFILVGLQLRSVLPNAGDQSLQSLLGDAAAVAATVVLLRIAWVGLAQAAGVLLARARGRPHHGTHWREAAIVGWAGMRGGDSLAAALALPTVTLSGAAFPDRGLLIFLTFSAILATLVIQGLTLPLLVRRFGLNVAPAEDPEEIVAEQRLAEVALARLEVLARQLQAPAAAVDRARAELLHELRDLHGSDPQHEREDETTRRLQLELVEAQRLEAVRLRDASVIGDDVLYHLLRALDLEAARLQEPE